MSPSQWGCVVTFLFNSGRAGRGCVGRHFLQAQNLRRHQISVNKRRTILMCLVQFLNCGKTHIRLGLPGWLRGKEYACNARDLSSTPGLGTSPGEGNGNPLWYFCLANPLDRGAWRATVHGVAKSRTRRCMSHHMKVLFYFPWVYTQKCNC